VRDFLKTHNLIRKQRPKDRRRRPASQLRLGAFQGSKPRTRRRSTG
jgi:hypothetical protein